MTYVTQCDVCTKVFVHTLKDTTFRVLEYAEGVRPGVDDEALDICSTGCLVFYAADLHDETHGELEKQARVGRI